MCTLVKTRDSRELEQLVYISLIDCTSLNNVVCLFDYDGHHLDIETIRPIVVINGSNDYKYY